MRVSSFPFLRFENGFSLSFAVRTSGRRHHHARLHVESVAECRNGFERVHDPEVEIP